MKKFLALIALFCHINSSMFLPQTPEVDVFDANGTELNDVNSLTEYVIETFSDADAIDEDDDTAQEFLLVRTADLFCEVQPVQPPQFFRISSADLRFTGQRYCLPAATGEILSPPPEC
jgi:hypothetical protein